MQQLVELLHTLVGVVLTPHEDVGVGVVLHLLDQQRVAGVQVGAENEVGVHEDQVEARVAQQLHVDLGLVLLELEAAGILLGGQVEDGGVLGEILQQAGLLQQFEGAVLVRHVAVDGDDPAVGHRGQVGVFFGEHGQGFDVDSLTVGELVALLLHLGFQVGQVLEVVGVQGAVAQG